MVYRITIQKVEDGVLGEVVEIIETERSGWKDIFTFVDEYRRELGGDKEMVFLFNGFLMDESGDCSEYRSPRALRSIEEAQIWADANGFEVRVVKGERRGDRIVEVAS